MTIMPMKPGAGTIEEILAMPALPGMQPPATPFVWGQGGAQLTPEQLAGQRDIASALAQADYSPVQNWAQGLGRVLDNFDGSQRLKKLNGQEAQMSADRLAQITGLAGEANADLAPGLASSDPLVQAVANAQFQARTPKQAAPTEWERTLQSSGVMPGTEAWTKAMAQKVANTLDPWTNLVSGGESFMGRQSQVQQAMGGGGPVSSGEAAPMTQGDAGFADFSGASRLIKSLGGDGFVKWQNQFGTPVQVTSPDELNALPAGAIYVGPDGVKRQK